MFYQLRSLHSLAAAFSLNAKVPTKHVLNLSHSQERRRWRCCCWWWWPGWCCTACYARVRDSEGGEEEVRPCWAESQPIKRNKKRIRVGGKIRRGGGVRSNDKTHVVEHHRPPIFRNFLPATLSSLSPPALFGRLSFVVDPLSLSGAGKLSIYYDFTQHVSTGLILIRWSFWWFTREHLSSVDSGKVGRVGNEPSGLRIRGWQINNFLIVKLAIEIQCPYQTSLNQMPFLDNSLTACYVVSLLALLWAPHKISKLLQIVTLGTQRIHITFNMFCNFMAHSKSSQPFSFLWQLLEYPTRTMTPRAIEYPVSNVLL